MNCSIITAAVAGLFALVLASAASAQMGGGRGGPRATQHRGGSQSMMASCTVGSVGSSGFTCGGQSYQAGSGILNQIHSGMHVRVRYHMSGSMRVADSVS